MPPSFELLPDAFVGGPPEAGVPILVAATDMDRDGDDDVLINRHNKAPLELWRNEGGRFRHVPNAESGLFEHPGVVSFFADPDVVRQRIRERQEEALYVWHELERPGWWYFELRRPEPQGPWGLEIRSNRKILNTRGAAKGRAEGNTVRMSFGRGLRRSSFQIQVEGRSHSLVVEPEERGDAGELAAVPIRVGADLALVGPVFDGWLPDPHGVAWVDIGATPIPELYVGRGALSGTLTTSQRPKSNRYFEPVSPTGYRLVEPGTFPPDWGRARQVAWVDVERDGRPELFVGNRTSPNALYALDAASARYVDRAPELGLDLENGETFAWLDLDEDGRDDVLFLDEHGRLGARRNVAGTGFEPLDPDALGLALEPFPGQDGNAEFFETLVIHVADFDADGRLDLLMTGEGPERRTRLFLRRGEAFSERTTEYGLATGLPPGGGLPRTIVASCCIDADDDGLEDVVGLTEWDVWLLWNRGDAFERVPLAADWSLPRFSTVGVLDADGDGHEDLVCVAAERRIARNRAQHGNRALSVTFAGPAGARLGTLVTARYTSGRQRVQRFGSHRNPTLSQTAGPLHFGVRAGDSIESLLVEGGAFETPAIFELAADATSFEIPAP